MNLENLTDTWVVYFVVIVSRLIAVFFSTMSEERVTLGNVRGLLFLKGINIYSISGSTRLMYNIN
jgi:hypothetical protein